MAHPLRALGAHPEDLCSTPSTHMEAHSYLNSSSRDPTSTSAHQAYTLTKTDVQATHTYTQRFHFIWGLYIHTCVQMWVLCPGKPGVLDLLELELQTILSHMKRAVGTKLESSKRALPTLTSWVISPVLLYFIQQLKLLLSFLALLTSALTMSSASISMPFQMMKMLHLHPACVTVLFIWQLQWFSEH